MEKQKLTICFFAQADDLEIHSLKWIRYFADKGHDVHLFSYSSQENQERKNIKTHIIKKKFPTAVWPWNTLLNLPFSVVSVKNLIKKINPDIIHALCFTSYGTLATLSGYRPLIITAFGSDILINPRKYPLTKLMTTYALKKADLVTCDAEHMEKAMVNLGADKSKIKIINFGIDVKKFSPGSKDIKMKKELGLSDFKTIISLKWLEPLSDIETLIRAASLVVKKTPDVKFILVGPGSLKNELKTLSRNLGVDKNIIFLGFISNEKITDYLRISDVLVSTAISDAGLAASTAEAMSCGLPVIVTDFGDNRKWIKDGENGFIVPAGNPEMFAEKITYLIRNNNIGKKFGEINRKIIEEKNNYYWEMGKMENIYKELVQIKNQLYGNSQKRKYQICTKCIMDTSDPEITFDENGVCNHCKFYEKITHYLGSEKELKEEVKKIKESGKGKKYDCVVGVSGGVDSSMALYMAKKLGLRPLAIHLDNCWDTGIAQANIERVVRKLNVDLFTYVINWEEFKDLQVSFLKASVSNIDYPYDHAILAFFYDQAAKNGVKYIIHGSNIKTECVMPKAWGYHAMDYKHLKVIHDKFGTVKLKTHPVISIWKLMYYSLVKKIKRFRIIDYIDYDKAKAKDFLIKEFGWQDYGGKHNESVYTRFFINYVLPKKFGFDRRRAWFSNLIYSGQITREEALKEMAKINSQPLEEVAKEDNEYVIKKLGLTNEEFKKIMAAPVKDHKEYPSDSLFFEKLIFIYSFIKKILVG